MLYLVIPAQNEVATIGVLLWRLRTVLAEFPREYEVVVYDDASSDETAEVAEQYAHAMPVTVLRGKTAVGYAGAVDALARHVSGHTRYPRRDAMLILQGDFTDPPGIVPEFARRFEGGADLVVGERTAVVDAPKQVRRLFTMARLALKPFVRVDEVKDLTSSMRLIRISALRELLKSVGNDPICEGDTWTSNADLLLRLLPHARRVETVPMEPTYGVRTRLTRRITVRDALAVLRWGWQSRGRRRTSATADEASSELQSARPSRAAPNSRRRDEPEVTAEKLRERSRERDRLRGDADGQSLQNESRSSRDRSRGSRSAESRDTRRPERPSRSSEEASDHAAPPRESTRESARDNARVGARDQSTESSHPSTREGGKNAPRVEATPRPTPAPKRPKNAPVVPTDDMLFDDPFAGPPRTSIPRETPPTPPTFQLPFAASESGASTSHRGPGSSDAADDRDSDSDDNSVVHDALLDTTTNSTTSDQTSDADSPDAESPDAEAEDAEVRERKRRRNRRSRRRKSKLRGKAAGADGDSEGEGLGDADANAEADGEESDDGADNAGSENDPPGRKHRPGRKRRSDIDRAEGDTDDRAEGGTDDGAGDDTHDGAEGDTDDGAEGDTEDGAENTRSSRARRRGRRGRRGGNRRSRGRGSDDATGEASGETIGGTEGGTNGGSAGESRHDSDNNSSVGDQD